MDTTARKKFPQQNLNQFIVHITDLYIYTIIRQVRIHLVLITPKEVVDLIIMNIIISSLGTIPYTKSTQHLKQSHTQTRINLDLDSRSFLCHAKRWMTQTDLHILQKFWFFSGKYPTFLGVYYVKCITAILGNLLENLFITSLMIEIKHGKSSCNFVIFFSHELHIFKL